VVQTKAVETVRSAVAALNGGSIDGYLAYFDPAAKRWPEGLEQPITLPIIRDGLEELFKVFAGFHLDEDLLFGDERFVCARWRMRGVLVGGYMGFLPAGQAIDVETCELYDVNDDLVVEGWVYGDVIGQLSRQLGT
jgi:predicted ester cyclase